MVLKSSLSTHYHTAIRGWLLEMFQYKSAFWFIQIYLLIFSNKLQLCFIYLFICFQILAVAMLVFMLYVGDAIPATAHILQKLTTEESAFICVHFKPLALVLPHVLKIGTFTSQAFVRCKINWKRWYFIVFTESLN